MTRLTMNVWIRRLRVLAACVPLLYFQLQPQASESENVVALGLEDAINIALEENLSIKRSLIQLLLQENEVDASESADLPTLDANFSVRERTYSTNGEPLYDAITSTETISGSLSLGYNLIDGGTKDLQLEKALLNLEASEKDLSRSRQQALYQVVSQYFFVLLKKKTILIREEELAVRENDLERIQLDFDNGIRVQSDVFRQEAQVAESQRQLIAAKSAYTSSLVILQKLLYFPLKADLNLPEEEYVLVDRFKCPKVDIDTSFQQLEERPDIISQSIQIESAERSIRIAERGNHFTLNASASLSSEFSNSGRNLNFTQQFIDREPELGLGLTLNIPILDRNKTKTNTLRSRLQFNQEELSFKDLLQTAQGNIVLSASNCATAESELSAAETQLKSSTEALKAEEVRFGVGATTLLDLNTLRNSRLSAALQVEQSKYDLFNSRLSLAFYDGSIERFLIEQSNISYQ